MVFQNSYKQEWLGGLYTNADLLTSTPEIFIQSILFYFTTIPGDFLYAVVSGTYVFSEKTDWKPGVLTQ